MPGIMKMLATLGRRIHVRISSPPMTQRCHYGIDMSTREEMVTHNRTVAEVCAEIGADSSHCLSLAGIYKAVGGGAAIIATRASQAITARALRVGGRQALARAPARPRLTLPPAAAPRECTAISTTEVLNVPSGRFLH